MTDQIFFDTDCLSAFLWVKNENLIVQLYKSRLGLPQQVYDELKKVPPLKTRIDSLIASGDVVGYPLVLGTPEGDLYLKLITKPDSGYKLIGKGEAAAISLAKYNNGILGSNNMRDIRPYIELYKLKHITTGEILVEALNKGLITEGQGNVIWANMINRQRILPTVTFSGYLARRNPK
jgi:predicted nucleic acid-binding protein